MCGNKKELTGKKNFFINIVNVFNTFFKYIFSSGISFLIDIILFHSLCVIVFKEASVIDIWMATIVARICSSLFNYYLNRKFVFKDNQNYKKTILKYYTLCILQMSTSAALVSMLYSLLEQHTTLIKIVVDCFLFLVNYGVQKKLIFKSRN